MFFQLGNIVFNALFTPDTFDVEGDDAVYAEHSLINGKPRLQKTGDGLQTVSLELNMRSEFCNVAAQLQQIKTSKEAGTVLALLMGNGRYVSDYVIISNNYSVEQALPDGTPVQVRATLTIKEHVTYDRLQQKKSLARSNALGVGRRSPVINRPAQAEIKLKTAARMVTETTLQGKKIDTLTSELAANPSNASILATKISRSCDQAQSSIESLEKQIDEVGEEKNKYDSMIASGKNVYGFIKGIKNQYPFQNVSDLKAANGFLQSALSSFQKSSAPLMSSIITRQAAI